MTIEYGPWSGRSLPGKIEKSYKDLGSKLETLADTQPGWKPSRTDTVVTRVTRFGQETYDVELRVWFDLPNGEQRNIKITRSFAPDSRTVGHDVFSLPPELQAQGVSPVVIQHALDTYKELDFDRIILTANLTSGTYVWARYGFMPSGRHIKRMLPALAERGAKIDVDLMDTWSDDALKAWFRDNLEDLKEYLINDDAKYPAANRTESNIRWDGEGDLDDANFRSDMESYLGRQAARSPFYQKVYPGRKVRLEAPSTPELEPNKALRALVLRHQIALLRYAEGLRTKVLNQLASSERDLRDLLIKRLVGLANGDLRETYTQKRLESLIEAISEIRTGVVRSSIGDLEAELNELIADEAEFTAEALKAVAPVELDVLMPSPEKLAALVKHQPFEGRILSEWADDIAEADLQRIRGAIINGMTAGENVDTITRRVMGSGPLNGADGILQLTRNNASAITRTAVNSFSNAARAEVSEANADIISEEVYLATLDARTTAICRALDGNKYPRGEGPHPPSHFQCRSVRIPLIDGRLIGNRPLKAITDKQILREYTAENGLEKVTTRKDLPKGHKTTYDTYARKRIAETTRVVDANITYEQFLRDQPEWFQNDVLGKDKARLFREGGLTLDRFVDANGRQYSLAELRTRETETFQRVFGDRKQPYRARSPDAPTEHEERLLEWWSNGESDRAENFPAFGRISSSEHAMMNYYTAGGFKRLNRVLRGREKVSADDLGKAREIESIINSALKRMPKGEIPKVLYRGNSTVTPIRQAQLDAAARAAREGKRFVVKTEGFMSTTAKEEMASTFSQGYYLKIVDPVSGRDISPLARYAEEEEYLFPSGTHFEVIGIDEQDIEDDFGFSSRTVLSLREVKPERGDIIQPLRSPSDSNASPNKPALPVSVERTPRGVLRTQRQEFVDDIVDKTRASGHEYAAVMTQEGRVLWAGTSNSSSYVELHGMPEKMSLRKGSGIEVHHTHPGSGEPLSIQDMLVTRWFPYHVDIYAHDMSGSHYKGRLRRDMSPFLEAQSNKALRFMMETLEVSYGLDREEASNLAHHLLWKAWKAKGWANYSYVLSGDIRNHARLLGPERTTQLVRAMMGILR